MNPNSVPLIGGRPPIKITIAMQAVIIAAQGAKLMPLVNKVMDPARDTMHWGALDYGKLSNAQKAGISWLYAIWHGGPVPEKWMDPFSGFALLDHQAKAAMVIGLSHRHGFGLHPPKTLLSVGTEAPEPTQ